MKKQRGQAIVQYGVLLGSVIAATYIFISELPSTEWFAPAENVVKEVRHGRG